MSGLIEVSMLGACPHEDTQRVRSMLNAMAVDTPGSVKRREVGLVGGAGKDEVRICLQQDLQQAAGAKSAWRISHRGAWLGSRLYRRSPVSSFRVTSSSAHGDAATVTALWRSAGFEVAYDVVKEGARAVCHAAGFGIEVLWCQVTDQRNGAVQPHLAAVTVLEATARLQDTAEVAGAEAALQAFATACAPVVTMGPAH